MVVTPTAANALAVIKVNGTTVASGTASPSIPLHVGANIITTIVTLPGDTTTQTYTLTATRAPQLDSVVFSSGTISPAFSPAVFSYTIHVLNATSSIQLTPSVNDTSERITVNGTAVLSGSPSAGIPLVVGNDTIKVVVTAHDGSSPVTYTVIITRASPPATLSYAGPQTYYPGTTITPLTPTSSNVAAYGYNSTATTVFKQTGVFPFGIAFDRPGNLYAATGATILKIPVNGGSPTVFASGFSTANAIAFNIAGDAYIADGGGNGLLYKIPAGTTTRKTIANFLSDPIDVAVDGKNNVYVLGDVGGSDVSTYHADVRTNRDFGSFPDDMGGLAIDNLGNAFVTDIVKNKVFKIDTGAITGAAIAGGFNNPQGLTVDGSGDVFVVDQRNNAVKMIHAVTNSVTTVCTGLNSPQGIKIGPDGYLYVNNVLDGTIKKIRPAGGYVISPQLPTGLLFNNTTGTISGKPQVSSPATNYTITAYTTTDSVTATVNIRVLAHIATLAGISLNNGAKLNPVFNTTTTTYTASVPYADTTVTIVATPTDTAASIKINSAANVRGIDSVIIHLKPGINKIVSVVTSADGFITKTYTVNLTRLDTAAAISNITSSDGTLSPAFSATTANYSITVPFSVDTLHLTATAPDTLETIAINHVTVTSGVATGIPINVGNTTIPVVATALDGSSLISYSVVVTRLTAPLPSNDANLKGLSVSTGTRLTSSMSHDITNFSTSVDFNATSITVTPTPADSAATAAVNGVIVPNGTASGAITLNTTGNTVIDLLVTARDGVTTRSYTITVSRTGSNNANLKGLTLSTGTLILPITGESTGNYSTSVGFTATSLNVKPLAADSNAVVTVNGIVVPNGSTSAPVALNTSGTTTINILVTAQDGVTTRAYTITVARTGSSNASCAIALTPAVTLIKTAGPADANFTAAVDYGIDSVLVRPVTADSNATVTVNGVAVPRGSASAPVYLNTTGATPINVVVTAQDGVTTRSYFIAVSHAALGNANLRYIKVDEQTIVPPAGTGTYSGSVTETASNQVYITAFPVDTHGTVSVNGYMIYSPTWKFPTPGALTNAGLTYDIVVTASDKVTTREFLISVSNGNAGAASPVIPDNTELVVHTALSPNGDGIDDYLKIDGISAHPDNTLSIMDSNGALVYTKHRYDNATNAFDGHASNGKMQKPGTYYYVLRYKVNNEVKVKSGYVVLKY